MIDFKNLPYTKSIKNVFSYKDIQGLFKEYPIVSSDTELLIMDNKTIANDKVVRKSNNEDIYIEYSVMNNEDALVSDFIFYFSDAYINAVDELISSMGTFIIKQDEDIVIDIFNVICVTNGKYELEPLDIDYGEDTIAYYYNKNSFKAINKLIKEIKKSNDNTVNILYGEYGIGKTTLMYYIATKLERPFIFIPNNMVDLTFNNPEFYNFILDYPNCVLVIDDCEVVFSDFIKSSFTANNITQIVDSPISKTVSLDIFMIFNGQKNNIDKTLLKCNNITLTEITDLSLDEANSLIDMLGLKKIGNKTKLVDILKKNKAEIKKIGF